MNRIEGAKDNLINACMYFICACEEQGVGDVNKEVVDIIATSFKLSNSQKLFIENSKDIDCKTIIDNLINFVQALKTKNICSSDIELIINNLSIISMCIKQNGGDLNG